MQTIPIVDQFSCDKINLNYTHKGILVKSGAEIKSSPMIVFHHSFVLINFVLQRQKLQC